jgi:TIR domain
MKVVVSHSSKDTWVARQLANAIKDIGVTTFIAEADIARGGDFEEALLNHLRECSDAVALITPWSIDRPELRVELRAAWAANKRIALVLHGLSKMAPVQEGQKFLATPGGMAPASVSNGLNDLGRRGVDRVKGFA